MPSLLSNTSRSDPSRPPLGGSAVNQHERLFSIFVLCRTTFEDLSRRTAAYGDAVTASVIAAYLTGRCSLPSATHNVVAGAINRRLQELSRPAAVPYRWPGDDRT